MVKTLNTVSVDANQIYFRFYLENEGKITFKELETKIDSNKKVNSFTIE